MYQSVFYFLLYVKYISMVMSEEQVSEERDMDLNQEEDIIMECGRDQHYSYVSNDGNDKNNMHALRWYGVYT